MITEDQARKLQQKVSDLSFALQDAWPYVHQWCTIDSVKNRVKKALFEKDNDKRNK